MTVFEEENKGERSRQNVQLIVYSLLYLQFMRFFIYEK